MLTTPTESAQELRQRAEEQYRMSEKTASLPYSSEETKQILYELREHQIQLEM
jgi:hypothetical protein